MTVVVTGGAGRLGRSVLERWVATGERVVNLDRRPSIIDGVEDVTVDLTSAEQASVVFARLRPRTVVHLAAISAPFSAPEPVILSVNTSMAYNVLTAAAAAHARHVLVASSPTVIGYGAPQGWIPERLPLDESHPLAPWNAYAASKVAVETLVGMAARRDGATTRFGVFRPCYVIAPEEWAGALTQQGHTVRERLARPELAAVSLFNYVDSRDAADFTVSWDAAADAVGNATAYFVGAADALARSPLSELIARYTPELAQSAESLTGSTPAFDCSRAARELGWRARRTWRSELAEDVDHGVRSPNTYGSAR